MTEKQPTLLTERLVLRPFEASDAHEVQRLAGEREIAATTINIPHPYEDGVAEKWIASHPERFEKKEVVNFAICDRTNGHLIGAISLFFSPENQRAEIGYYIGKPHWGNGYCTEAAREMLRYAFEELGLNRIFGEYMAGNPASGRVMEKIGMKYEGCLRQHIKKWDEFQDMKVHSILKCEYRTTQNATKCGD
ncbi:MAG: GNAT family N-acetyltransferase [Candidatus Coatesbacteria bacterium]|nr:GNAT family N-acetyltransferase [Candidatus Coatesbacteria bacterium]